MTACKCSRRLILWIEWIRVSDNWGMISRMIYPNSIGATDPVYHSTISRRLAWDWAVLFWFALLFTVALLLMFYLLAFSKYFLVIWFLPPEKQVVLANFVFDIFFELFFWYFRSSFFGICFLSAFVWCGNEKCCSRLSRGECDGAARFYSIIFWRAIFDPEFFSKNSASLKTCSISLSVYFFV